jgi:uncharacterized protein (DUF1697 family)
VYFLASRCPKADAERVAEADVAPELVQVADREIYAWHVDGVQKSPLSTLLTKRISVAATARNWNTVLKLRELTR